MSKRIPESNSSNNIQAEKLEKILEKAENYTHYLFGGLSRIRDSITGSGEATTTSTAKRDQVGPADDEMYI